MKLVIDASGTQAQPYRFRVIANGTEKTIGTYKTMDAAQKARRTWLAKRKDQG